MCVCVQVCVCVEVEFLALPFTKFFYLPPPGKKLAKSIVNGYRKGLMDYSNRVKKNTRFYKKILKMKIVISI